MEPGRGDGVTVQASRVGAQPAPATDHHRPCKRCGIVRKTKAANRDRLCQACQAVVEDLGERGRWV